MVNYTVNYMFIYCPFVLRPLYVNRKCFAYMQIIPYFCTCKGLQGDSLRWVVVCRDRQEYSDNALFREPERIYFY